MNRKMRASFLALMMIVSVFAGVVALSGSVAAQSTIDSAGNPDDIPGGTASASQNVTAGTPGTNITLSGSEFKKGNQHAIKVDLTDLQDAGADLSSASLSTSVNRSHSVDFQNIAPSASEARLVVTNGTDNEEIGLQLTINGISTEGVATAQNLEYTITADANNSGDFGSNFRSQAIAQTPQFGIASVEVADLDTGDSVVETSLTDAIKEANDANNQDLGTTPSNTIEIRLRDGTYQTTNNQITADNTRIVATEGSPVIQNDGNFPTLEIQGDTVIEGVTFDQNDNANGALNVSDGNDLSLTDSIFKNPAAAGGSDVQFLNITDNAGTVDIQNVTFDGDNKAEFEGIRLNDSSGGADITIEDSTFTKLDIGLNASDTLDQGADGPNSFSASNNEFSENNIHVENDQDSTEINLDTIFSDNSFDQYVVTENDNNQITTDNLEYAIYGDLSEADDGAAESNIDTKDHTTLISEGDHTLDNFINVTADDVTVTTPSGAAVENVTVDVSAADAISLQDNNDVSGLSVSGITFEMEANRFLDVTKGNTDEFEGLSINNNRFTEIGGTTVIDLSFSDSDGLIGSSITDNTFEPTGDGSSYTAVLVDNVTEVGSASTTTITGNVINGSGASKAIDITALNSPTDNQVTLSVSDNTIRKTGSSLGIELTNPATSDTVDVRVNRNTISASDAGNANAILVSAGSEATVSVANNEISDFDDDNAATAIDASGFDQVGLTVEDNRLTNNAEQITFTDQGNTDAGVNPSTIRQNNNYDDFLLALDSTSGDALDNLDADVFHGTVASAINEAGGSDTIVVFDGTYDETSLSFDNNGQTLRAASGDSPTITPVSGDTSPVFNLNSGNNNLDVEGLTIDSSGVDVGNRDVQIDSSDRVTLTNNVFIGTTDRTAIEADGSGTIDLQRNEISGYNTGILVDITSKTNMQVVENQITDNNLGIDIDDAGIGPANIHFNNIVNNEVGVENDESDDVVNATANWWGDTTGPSGAEFNGDGDEIAGGQDQLLKDNRTSPWLSQSVTNLPRDEFVVVTDPTAPIADFDGQSSTEPNAEVIVAVLNESVADNTDQSSTRLLSDPSDPISNIGQPGNALNSSGNGNSTVPFFFEDVESEAAGDYTFTARDADGNVQRGSSVQTYSGTPSDVEVTVDDDNLVADGTDTVNITLQVVDSNGEPVSDTGTSVTFLIDGSSDAEVTRVNEETQTDANGQAELRLTAENAGIELDITGVYDPDGYSDSATVNTTLNTLDVDISTGTATAEEESDVTVNVSSAASGNAVENAEVAFSGPGVDQSAFTNADGSATATFTPSEAGTIDVNVSADGFVDVTESITVEEAGTGSPLDGPAGRFDNNADGDISITELGDAGTAFAQGDLTIAELGAVGQEFAS